MTSHILSYSNITSQQISVGLSETVKGKDFVFNRMILLYFKQTAATTLYHGSGTHMSTKGLTDCQFL